MTGLRLPFGLRFFGERRSAPGRVEALLLASDVVELLAPLAFAASLACRPEALADGMLLGSWAAIPRCLSRFLGGISRSVEGPRMHLYSALGVLMLSGLILAGWELLYTSAPATHPLGFGTAIVAIGAWASGFLIFLPRAYRLFDFLAGAVLLLGLFEQKPDYWLWTPLFLLSLYLSSSLRRLLEVHAQAPKAGLNLQNSRALALSGSLLAALVFFALVWLFRGSLGEPRPPPPSAGARDGRPQSSFFIAMPEPAAHRGSDAGGAGAEPVPAAFDGEPPRPAVKYRGDLESFASLPPSRRPSLVLRAAIDGGPASAAIWPPGPAALYRGVTFSSYDPKSEEWLEDGPIDGHSTPDRSWIAPAVLRLPPDGAPALELEVEVLTPVFPTLVGLFASESFRIDGTRSCRVNAAGDVFPNPPPRTGQRYRLRAHTRFANRFPSQRSSGAEDPLPSRALYRRLPVGFDFDFAGLGKRVFSGAGPSALDRVEALRAWMVRQGFTYSRVPPAQRRGSGLREFLIEGRRGSCAHYATAAALLLRAGGVATRVAVGFAGGEWDAEREELSLPLSAGHAWVEVHFPGSGWHALDATAWVPRHPDSPPDSIAAGAGEPFPDDDGEPAPEAKAAAEGGVPSRPSRLGDGGRAPPSGAPLPAADAAARRRVPGDSAAATPANGESDAIEWLRFGAWEEGGPRRAARRVEDGGAWAPDAAARRGQPLDAAASGDAPERRFGAATLNSVKRPLRMLLIALAMVALLLVWISFRRSKRRAEEKEKEAVDDGDGDAETGAGAAADAADFEFDAGDPRQAIIGGYHRLQADLAPFEQARKPWQTPAEHGRELSRRFSGLRDAAARLVELFHRALYGARAVGEKERRDFEAQDRRIRRRLR